MNQEKFVKELIKGVREDILQQIKHIPEEWDGIELRMFIADHFQKIVFRTTRGRVRDYHNEVYTKNLI